MKPTIFDFEFDGKTYTVDSTYFSKEKHKKLTSLAKKIFKIKDYHIILDRENISEFLVTLSNLRIEDIKTLHLGELARLYFQVNEKIRQAWKLQSN